MWQNFIFKCIKMYNLDHHWYFEFKFLHSSESTDCLLTPLWDWDSKVTVRYSQSLKKLRNTAENAYGKRTCYCYVYLVYQVYLVYGIPSIRYRRYTVSSAAAVREFQEFDNNTSEIVAWCNPSFQTAVGHVGIPIKEKYFEVLLLYSTRYMIILKPLTEMLRSSEYD